MSNVHIASAANEVAQALPSTATVTVSKHGIQSIETLNLEAQTATDSQVTWSRTFSGMEILTNPTINLRTKSTFTANKVFFQRLQNFNRLREAVRPASDPVANAANSLNVTVNNASMSITPSRDHRIVTSAYPDEIETKHQRKHYGLNQLDQFAESSWREFQVVTQDDVEKQHNSNALRENYPARWFINLAASGDAPNLYQVGAEDYNLPCVIVQNSQPAGDPGNTFNGNVNVYLGDQIIGHIGVDLIGGAGGVHMISSLDATSGTFVIDDAEIAKISADQLPNLQFRYQQTGSADQPLSFSTAFMVPGKNLGTLYAVEDTTNTELDVLDRTQWTCIYDIFEPLNHPYFRDNVMRDNTLVNVRYFDCQLTIDNTKRMIEMSRLYLGASNLDNVEVTTSLFLDSMSVGASKGKKPTLIFDLVTPSVPLPTISDKVIKTYHTITSTAVSLANGTDPYKKLNSGNIQLAQVPDMIYVFIRSSKDLNSYQHDAMHVPTRLGVITELRLRTPQNSAFLINMDQETLYQMSCRNGAKQARSSFMNSLGSVIAIDPEKDLGGYTNGVLIPFTFDVSANFSLPCRSGAETESILHGKDLKGGVAAIGGFDDPAGEDWTMFVVCELQGHLYLMSDGTGKQTKSNLTVTEVADAVADGIHHPSTFPPNRVSKMDAGVLGEVARSSAGEVGDDVRAALRA